MALRFDPKTGRVIVSDLTPSHKAKTSGVHGMPAALNKIVFFEDTIVSHENNTIEHEW